MIYLISNQTRIETDDIQIATVQDCLDYFSDKEIIEVDLETQGCPWNKKRLPDPYTSKVLCSQFGDANNQFVVDTAYKGLSEFRDIMEDKSKIKILQNAFFDLRFFWHKNVKIQNIYDTFLAECILTRGQDTPKGYKALDGMAMRYLEVYVSKTERGQIHWRGLDDTIVRYAANDVKWLNKIREKQLVELKRLDLLDYLKLENRFVSDLSYMSYKGFKVNQDKWKEAYKISLKEAQERETELIEYLAKHYSQQVVQDLFGQSSLVNFKSSKETVRFFKSIGINTEIRDKKTGEIKDTVDIKPMRRQINEFPILIPYINYKEKLKEISTYGIKFLKDNVNPITKRLHSEFFQILETGRISSNSPNLLNIPGEDKEGNTHSLRLAFETEEGNELIVADYSQQEPRITANYSQDPYLIDFIINGSGDSHSLISTMISEYLLGEHIEVTKANNPIVSQFGKPIRAIGKMINLGLDYGKTAYSIKDDLKTTQEEAQKLLDIIKAKTPVKTQYFKRWQNFVRQRGFIITDDVFRSKTFFGNYQRLKRATSNRDRAKYMGELERFAQNNRIQGTAGLMTKLAIIFFNNWIFEHNLQNYIWIVNAVHDEIVVESNKFYSSLAARRLKYYMEKSGRVFCKTIPMKADPSIGLWTH